MCIKQRGLLKKIKEAEERDLITYLLDFYTYDTSPYVREKLAHSQSIGKTYCKDSIDHVKTYWKKCFKRRPLASITREELREFSLSLKDKGLAASTINWVMLAGNLAFDWVYRGVTFISTPAKGSRALSVRRKEEALSPMRRLPPFSNRNGGMNDRMLVIWLPPPVVSDPGRYWV